MVIIKARQPVSLLLKMIVSQVSTHFEHLADTLGRAVEVQNRVAQIKKDRFYWFTVGHLASLAPVPRRRSLTEY